MLGGHTCCIPWKDHYSNSDHINCYRYPLRPPSELLSISSTKIQLSKNIIYSQHVQTIKWRIPTCARRRKGLEWMNMEGERKTWSEYWESLRTWTEFCACFSFIEYMKNPSVTEVPPCPLNAETTNEMTRRMMMINSCMYLPMIIKTCIRWIAFQSSIYENTIESTDEWIRYSKDLPGSYSRGGGLGAIGA